MAPRLIELSHVIEEGHGAYLGLPEPHIQPILTREASRARYGDKAEFELSQIVLSGNTGTYLDSPFHRFEDGVDLAGLRLDQVAALRGLVVDASAWGVGGPIRLDALPAEAAGAAILVRTGWDRHWGTDAYWHDGPFLPPEVLALLLAVRPALVGVDFSNVDDLADLARPAHTGLLRAGIPIVEHLTGLSAPPASGFRFHAVPLAIRRMTSMPVRAYAEIGD